MKTTFLLLLLVFTQTLLGQTRFKPNSLMIGSGLDVDMTYVVDRAGVDDPKLKWDGTTFKWYFSNDGLTFGEMVDKAYVDAAVAGATIPDATTTVKGKVQLAGDLAGTADAPTVPGLTLKAPLNSPIFTGDPQVPTPTLGDTDFSIANTAFVQASIASATVADATTSSKGIIQLAGDLGGTAAAPTVPALTTIDTRLDDAEAVLTDHEVRISGNETNIADLETTKADDSTVVHKAGDETITGNKYFTGRISTASTTAGNKICPEMTNTQMEAVTTPQNGDCVYNTDKKSPFFYSSVDSKWKQAGGGAASLELQSDPSFESGIGDGVVSGSFTASRVGTSSDLETPTNESMLQLQMGVGTGSYTVTKTLTDGQRGQPVFFGIWFKRLLAATCTVSAMVDGVVIYGSSKTVSNTSEWDFHYYLFTAGQVSVGYKFECTASLVDVAWLDQSKLVIDDSISPIITNVANVSSTVTDTCTSTWTTNTSIVCKWSRVGEFAYFDVKVSLLGAPNAANLAINLPSGMEIDTTKMSDINNSEISLGQLSTLDSSAPANFFGVVRYDGVATRVTLLYLIDSNTASSASRISSIDASSPFAYASGDSVTAKFRVPIKNWSATNPNALLNTQTVSTDFTPMFFKSTQCLETEIGCFNTYQYDGNPTPSNNKSLCTTAPTQVVSDFLTNGILLYSRPYNADSSCAQPVRFEIVIGKNMKTPQPITLYKNAGKLISGDIDFFQASADTIARGIRIKSYDSTTGILTLDAGYNSTGITSAGFDFNDNTSSSSGYVVLNFSKNPAVSGIDINSINQFAYIKDVKANGTDGGSTVAATWTNRVLNNLVNPSGIVKSLASNQFTLGPGTYRIVAENTTYQAAGVAQSKSRLRNVTDNVTTLASLTESLSVGSSDGHTATNVIKGLFTITKDTTFALQYWVSSARATEGLGRAAAAGEQEVYSQIEIQKISP